MKLIVFSSIRFIQSSSDASTRETRNRFGNLNNLSLDGERKVTVRNKFAGNFLLGFTENYVNI